MNSPQELLALCHDAIEVMPQGMVITDARRPDNPIIFCNRGFEVLTGYSRDEILNRNCRFLQGPETDPDALQGLRQAIRAGQAHFVVLRNYRKDGSPFWNALAVNPLGTGTEPVHHFVGVQTDITPIKDMEQRLLNAQKLETIGLLTAGVAHDFNNVLTVINGFSELVASLTPADDSRRELLTQIEAAGQRAAALTRQLLSFTRNQPVQQQVVDLNQIVLTGEKMFRRLAGVDRTVILDYQEGLYPIKADPGQVEQVIWNLIVNARDATAAGGTIAVRTRNDSTTGVVLEVADDGQGMSEAVRRRIFEPLYTTKPAGKGTGLGLATVQRIVQAVQGSIEVETEPGRGTTFRIRVPRYEGKLEPDSQLLGLRSADRGKECLLVVDDDPDVRDMMVRSLRFHGYTVLEASHGFEAQRCWETHEGPLALVVSDALMPGMSAATLRERLRASRPNAKLLLVSGYVDETPLHEEIEQGTLPFLAKPFSGNELAAAVRAALLT